MLHLLRAAFSITGGDSRPRPATEAWVGPVGLPRPGPCALPDVDDRVASLLCLLAHPGSFTTLLRQADRERVVEVFGEQLASPSGDLERDLKAITLSCRSSKAASRCATTPHPCSSSGARTSRAVGAWLVRGELDQQNRVPAWVSQGRVTLTVGRLTQLPAEPTQDALSSLVDERYADWQVVKREAKKRDVLAFVLGMRAGDLVATVDGEHLRLGRLAGRSRRPASRSAASTLSTRPVAWSADSIPTVKDLPAGGAHAGAVQGRGRCSTSPRSAPSSRP